MDNLIENKYLKEEEEESDFRRFQELSRLKTLADHAFDSIQQHSLDKDFKAKQNDEDLMLTIINQSLDLNDDNLYLQSIRKQIEEKHRIARHFYTITEEAESYLLNNQYQLAINEYISILPYISNTLYQQCINEIKRIESYELIYLTIKNKCNHLSRRIQIGEIDQAKQILYEIDIKWGNLNNDEHSINTYCSNEMITLIETMRSHIHHLDNEIIKIEQIKKIDLKFNNRQFELCIKEYKNLLKIIDPRIMRYFNQDIKKQLNLSYFWMNMKNQAEKERKLAAICANKKQFKMCLLHLTEAADLYSRVKCNNWEYELENIQQDILSIKRQKIAVLYEKGNQLLQQGKINDSRECYMYCALREPNYKPYARALKRTEILILLKLCDREMIQQNFHLKMKHHVYFVVNHQMIIFLNLVFY